MNEKKIAFVICANDELYLNECVFYINHLTIPDGYETDVISITEASCISEAYNAAMKESDAKYKVYLHQDVFILNRNFIADVVKIFEDETIGMIGMLGRTSYCEDAKFGVSWDTGKTLACNTKKVDCVSYANNSIDKVQDVVAIDGMLMVTQYDVEWKEEMTGWHFYDISQSIEFNKLGYRVVVPYQEKCWVLHDAEYCLMSNYDKDRETFCKIYADCGFVYRKEDDSRYTQMQERYINEKGRLIHCIECGEVNEAEKYAEKLKEICDADADADIVLFEILYEVYQQDRKKRGNSSVFSQKDWEKEKGIYNYIKFLTRRLEYGFELSEYVDLINIISKMVVSFDYVYAVVMHSTIFQERIWSELSFRLSGQVGQTEDEMLFDWYQRYHTLAEMIRRVKRVYHMDKSRILEVGANVQKNLGKELSEDDIYYTDLEVPEQFAYSRRYFQADATDLHEIKDNTFDFCVASDVFEHILPEKRASFIKELYRVADKAVFFCFPRKSAKVEEAEKEVNAHFRAITGENHRWLKEHIDNGLPDCDTVDDYLKQQNITFATFEHGELEMWKKIQKVHSIEVICPDCVEMRTCIDQFYNKHIYKYDMGKENYRIFYVLMKNGKMDGFEDMFENCENEENERQIYEMCDEMLQICILRNSVLNRI